MNPKPHLTATLKNLPKKSGIYQYYDHKGHLLYIGKAKNLFNRIRSYFRISDGTPNKQLSPRIYNMVLKIETIKIIIVDNQTDALILENSLIKQLKPRYNILLRDDKTYPYIFFDLSQPFPRPQITRIKRTQKQLEYFGPFTQGARDILQSLYELLPLVQKSSCPKEKKACLFFQINRCKAPCENKITPSEYAIFVQQAIAYLKDKRTLIKQLEEKMQTLASQERFERALILRDRIAKISTLEIQTPIDLHQKNAQWDIFYLMHEARRAVLLKLYMRNGKIIASDYERFSLQYPLLSLEDETTIYQQAIINHYQKNLPLPPQTLLLPKHLSDGLSECQQWLKESQKIDIVFPQKGIKAQLLQLAKENAQEQLKIQDEESPIKEALKDLCELTALPHKIEVFDTSHHNGAHNVGAMIVYEDGRFLKSAYRHYMLEGSDESSQMREMLTRRAKDFERSSPPDLWLLDGGVAQIHIAQEVLESAGVHIDIVAIAKEKLDAKAHRAKGRAKDILRAYIDTQCKSFALLPSDKRLQFCQKLRDEAHRFAINFHRKKKLQSFIPKL
ncbi:excinuclease ABC subunit C [Helicobacter enhydrae]|uniref:Excinuclease ABC subunit C n=1 Tax=Helicobacter enhydrae TaxID=222136 RepID=A0A1B1U4B3_9HELI|nr:excinuclease ABC subunit UvrC [Helicobacter enhydrae]ANV97545.1 excinuclease ABC subunit C [Helicobacter enhydrae]